MSLKAKLEAVIYAAEEPVTLAQLAAIFASEALEHKAEQAARAASEQAQPDQPLPLLEEGFAYLGLEQTQAFYAAADGVPAPGPAAVEPGQAGEGAQGAAKPVETEGDPGASAAPVTDAAAGEPANQLSLDEPEAPAEAAVDPADAEAAQKREARQRDREIRAVLQGLIDELIAECAADGRGVEVREIAGGYRMATKPECHDAVRSFVRSLKPPLKLSLQALETLAVVAYKQPVTAPEVSEIRGVESAGTLGSLLSRKLIATAGRKQVIGRPILYKTTREFLLRFGLKDVSELPSMEEFEKMAAVELDDQTPDEAETAAELASENAEAAETKESKEETAELDPAETGQETVTESEASAQ